MLVGLALLLLLLGLVYVWAEYPKYLMAGIWAAVFLGLSWLVVILTMGWLIEIFGL